MTSAAARRNGSPLWSLALPPANGGRLEFNIVSSSPKSNTVTISSSSVALLWTVGGSLLDANRSLGHPDSLTVIFGRRIQKRYQGKLQTVIEDMHLGNQVLRAHYKNGFLKQYVRDHRILRTEPATNSVLDYGVKKAIDNLPQLRERAAAILDRCLDVEQDILETFVDRGQLEQLRQPTLTEKGRRIPRLKLDRLANSR